MQQFERATMLKLPIQPLLVLCSVTASTAKAANGLEDFIFFVEDHTGKE
jgi:hypothetical protein